VWKDVDVTIYKPVTKTRQEYELYEVVEEVVRQKPVIK